MGRLQAAAQRLPADRSSEHDLRSSAFTSSSDRPHRTSSPCTPPTRAFVARHCSRLSGTLRLIAGHRAFGSWALQHTSPFLIGTAQLTPVRYEEPAMPSYIAQWLSHKTSAVPNPCEPPQGLQVSRSSGAVPILIRIRKATASLTPACSGLAALAADARR